MYNISIDDLKKILYDDIKLIDIRDKYQYNIGNIPKSVNIPMNFLLMNPENYLEKNTKYYIYCEYGGRSEKVCKMLSNRGYNVVNVLGGYNEYKLFNYKS